jgi:arginine utilization regulatory protein
VISLAVVDLIIKIDSKFCLKEIIHLEKSENSFDDCNLANLIGQKIDHILGTPISLHGGIVEIQNKFFKYQLVKESDESTLYLSHDGFLAHIYEQTINYVSEGIQIYDKNGHFLSCNPASENLENYNRADFEGKHLLDLYDVKEEYSTILTVLRTQKPVSNRCDRFEIKNGKSLTTINSGYPLKLAKKLYGAVVFESDLSVLKQVENKALNLETYVDKGQSAKENELYKFDDIIHSSKSMEDIIHFSKKISLTDSSILVVGATGSGKELIAQSIHSFSRRRHKNFIDINCSAIPYNLFESMFFGTEKGAFTGSIAKKGFFEMAQGGTIFLDEVNSISPQMQAKLLRVLQEKKFQRIGGSEYIKCDIRVIAAINEDPFKLIEQEKMRSDFYYRISTIKINIPPLKERKEDIHILADHFLKELCNLYNKSNLTISEDVLHIFLNYDWPGNIRELQNTIEYSFNCTSDNELEIALDCLPDYLKSLKSKTNKLPQMNKYITSKTSNLGTLEERLKILEKEIINQTIELNNGNITQSAKILGMSRQSLQYRMKKSKD